VKPRPDELIIGFFETLPRLDGLVRELTRDLSLVAGITLADTGETLTVDLTARPLTVRRVGDPRACTIRLQARSDHLHGLLLGEEPLGLAMTRKHVLVRGSAAKLGQFYPLLKQSALLYEEYVSMADDQAGATRRGRLRRAAARMGHRALHRGGWAAGYGLGLVKARVLPDLKLADLVASLSDGLAAGRRARRRR